MVKRKTFDTKRLFEKRLKHHSDAEGTNGSGTMTLAKPIEKRTFLGLAPGKIENLLPAQSALLIIKGVSSRFPADARIIGISHQDGSRISMFPGARQEERPLSMGSQGSCRCRHSCLRQRYIICVQRFLKERFGSKFTVPPPPPPHVTNRAG